MVRFSRSLLCISRLFHKLFMCLFCGSLWRWLTWEILEWILQMLKDKCTLWIFEKSLICFNGVLMCLRLTDTTLSLDSQIPTACHPAANHGLAWATLLWHLQRGPLWEPFCSRGWGSAKVRDLQVLNFLTVYLIYTVYHTSWRFKYPMFKSIQVNEKVYS